MKVLHVFNNLIEMPAEGSGEKTHNYFMGTAFRQLGHEIDFFEPATFSDNSSRKIETRRTIYHKLKKMMPKVVTDWLRDLYYIFYDLNYDKKILEVIRKSKSDLVFERITVYHDSGLRAAKKAKIPFIIEIHETHNALDYIGRINFSRYRRYIWIKVAKQADLVVVVSSMLKGYLVSAGVSADRIIVLPNAVYPELFVDAGKRDQLRKSLCFDDEIVLGFVGGMHAYHGIDLLPDLCERLIANRLNFKFLLVGNFDRRPGGEEGYRALLKERGLEDYFVLTGGVPLHDVPGYIEAIDVGLMPDSNVYGSPIKIFEYGSLAKPVVAPRYIPIEDVIEHDKNGLIFEPKSVAGMADQVLRLVSDVKLREQLGRQLQKDVLMKHTWKNNAARIIEAVARVSS